jgi:hypothetical protein
MADFEFTTAKVFQNSPSKKYINDCCVGGDEILNQIKNDIALEMNVDEDSIEIYQEDWGWALEFLKDNIAYLLAVNNASEFESSEALFTAFTQATRKEKGIFFNKNTAAEIELKNFSAVVQSAAKKNGFKVNTK